MSRTKTLILPVILGLFFFAFAQHQPSVPLVEINGEPMLLGQVAFSDILYYFDDWKAVYDTARVDTAVVHVLNQYPDSLHILLFLGTWCSDSREGVPPFMRCWEAVRNPRLSLTIVAVDRDKNDPDDLAPRWHIEKVPTFVVIQKHQEIGRLVEIPTITFARDLIQLLTRPGKQAAKE